MAFQIAGKVALISGGASGLGFEYAKALLRNGLKAVTLADINPDFGKTALHKIQEEFGPNKAIFVPTDVTNKQNYENAFKKTVEKFKQLDILINNAGVLNDSIWEKEVQINVFGSLYGTILGLEQYISKYKSGSEGLIVNISSIAGVAVFPSIPVYTGTKFFVHGMSKAFGHESLFKRTNVRVITLCPGAADTPLFLEMTGRTLGSRYDEIFEESVSSVLASQKPEWVASCLIKLIKDAKSGTAWVVEGGNEAYEYCMAPREAAPK